MVITQCFKWVNKPNCVCSQATVYRGGYQRFAPYWAVWLDWITRGKEFHFYSSSTQKARTLRLSSYCALTLVESGVCLGCGVEHSSHHSCAISIFQQDKLVSLSFFPSVFILLADHLFYPLPLSHPVCKAPATHLLRSRHLTGFRLLDGERDRTDVDLLLLCVSLERIHPFSNLLPTVRFSCLDWCILGSLHATRGQCTWERFVRLEYSNDIASFTLNKYI